MKEFKESFLINARKNMHQGKCLDDMSRDERMDYYQSCLLLYQLKKKYESNVEEKNNNIYLLNTLNHKATFKENYRAYLLKMKNIFKSPLFLSFVGFTVLLILLKFCDVAFLKVYGIRFIVDTLVNIALIPIAVMTLFIQWSYALNPLNYCVLLYHQFGDLALLKIIACYICGSLLLFGISVVLYHVYMSVGIVEVDDSEARKHVEENREYLLEQMRDIEVLLFEFESGYTHQYDLEHVLFNEEGIELLNAIEKVQVYSFQDAIRQAYEQYNRKERISKNDKKEVL